MWLVSFFFVLVVAQDFNQLPGEQNLTEPDALPPEALIGVTLMVADPAVLENAQPNTESALATINAGDFYAADESPKELTLDGSLSSAMILGQDLSDGQSPVVSLLVVNGEASEAGVYPLKPDGFQNIESNQPEANSDSMDSVSKSTRPELLPSLEDIAAVAPEQTEENPNDPNAPGLHIGDWPAKDPAEWEDAPSASWEGAQVKGLQEIETIQNPMAESTGSAVTIWVVGCTGAAAFALYLMRRLRQTSHPYDVFAQHRGLRLTSPGSSNVPAWNVFGRSSPGYIPVS
eukprot:Protomagalhaensia_wolfi_Nauph_80__1600@NODE_198_length_3209_cov_30_785804_g148_i0_p2_GENE_NODE_198_length_3209_cov_30_785804_g148_i0NODE_198_length_3209_cov_30_785804_g148_i0_p2_ORF_typecomplete_len289_score54_70DUF5129/PF17173_4/0_097_NODE_198_length_3209_cov_30_785804_g148_i024890